MTIEGLPRRKAITGAVGVGVAAPLLAACGGEDDDGGTATERETSSEAGSPAGGGDPLAATSDVPVGGGAIFEEQKVVVTQATEGDFRAFSAVCTHQGCLVGRVEGDQIQCPCHGSAFSIADGSVVNGPAEKPLGEMQITVDGDSIRLA